MAMNVTELAAFSQMFVTIYQTTLRHVHCYYYLLLKFSDQNLVRISDLCHVFYMLHPYPLLLTNKVNIIFVSVVMHMQLVLLEGMSFGR
jgi:hypothetical protein